MKCRVVVTGIGAISAAGPDLNSLVTAAREGHQCFTRLVDPSLKELRATHAALVPKLELKGEYPRELESLDRHVQLALVATREAIEQSGLEPPLGKSAAVLVGTCSGGTLSIEKHYEGQRGGGDCLTEEFLFSKRYYAAAKALAFYTGTTGPALTVTTACAAGSGAIAAGMDLIRAGLAQVVLAGGADSFALSTLAGFDALQATAVGITTPFSENVGLNLGEGAAFLVLENLDHALDRRGKILAELLGYGLSNDAYHPTAPDPSTRGQVAAIERALTDAGLDSEHIDYVNAHGTGTRANDPIESKTIAKVLKKQSLRVPVSSTKSIIGHCLGGAGALEIATTIGSAREGFIPPTAGFTEIRDGCCLSDYVPDAGREWSGRVALSNSFGFGGNNAAVLLDVAPNTHESIAPLPEKPSGKPVISGIGMVSPFGLGLGYLRNPGANCIGSVEGRFESPCEGFVAGLVPQLDRGTLDKRLNLKGMDLCSQYAALATRSALAHAGIKPRPSAMDQMGMVMGLASGPNWGESEHLKTVFGSGPKLDSLGAFPYVVPNSVAGNVARSMLIRGHNTVFSAGPGAGLPALINGVVALELSHVGRVLAVATDELTGPIANDGYETDQWGPQTKVVPGEGAAALVLELDDDDLSTGEPLAEILGYGLATDSRDLYRTGSRSLADALAAALERAGVEPEEIRGVASGKRGSPVDLLERQALEQVLGKRHPEPFSLANKIGFAEASLPLFNLFHLLATLTPESVFAAVFLSPEGFASAVILRKMCNVFHM